MGFPGESKKGREGWSDLPAQALWLDRAKPRICSAAELAQSESSPDWAQTVLAVRLERTAPARQARCPSLRAIRDAGPIIPPECAVGFGLSPGKP